MNTKISIDEKAQYATLSSSSQKMSSLNLKTEKIA